MKINPAAAALISLIVFFAGIAISDEAGLWKTDSSKQPVKYQSGKNAGTYNPADIRGSYTFKEISQVFDIPIEYLTKAFALQSDGENFFLRDLEGQYADSPTKIDTGSVRMFVAFYKGLPLEITEDTYLLEPAYEVIQKYGSPTEEQRLYLKNHLAGIT